MIVERLVWTVKPGKQAHFIEFLSPYLREKTNPIKRVYTPKIGVWGQVVAELEYENMAAWEAAWEEWQSPAKATEAEKESELATITETTIWDAVE